MLKVLMLPHLKYFRSEESGIKRVVEAYFEHLPNLGIDLVDPEYGDYDVKVVHAGAGQGADVAAIHGLYWTADYPAIAWEWRVNAGVIDNLREAKEITCPSEWVAETVRRDMRRNPHVVGHGIDWSAWQHDHEPFGHVLWNKNRLSDVCDPSPVGFLARKFPQRKFVSTFGPRGMKMDNVVETGVLAHPDMRQLVQSASVYLATVKETFGIGILEAMASGVPVLGYGHGGILEMVQHGVNGYLAAPGDLDDLTEGLDYCLRHGRTLGANGREMARAFTWEAACEKAAAVYKLAAGAEPARVTVVVPSYNYAAKVGRALESVAAQTFRDFECVVVDDGSTDGSEAKIPALLPDDRFRYVRQPNQGVAKARNHGVSLGSGKYVCCLDADDAIAPTFLATCVAALEEDRGLGIAYTGLRYVLPSGEEGVSPWPGPWDFDAQLKRRNQVPTCCLFRRDMWRALGGYRQRYAPKGAGSEDAEFWTRCGAYGWRAEKVTDEPLFVYSWQSGQVSGDPDYQEVDWLAWHPWAYDGLHPFASWARPRKFSHPVRQYDEPVVSVVIPVGPGHEEDVVDALDSLDAQGLRRWEAVVVFDGGEPPEPLTSAFPHVRWLYIKGEPAGAGAARNFGATAARAPFLLFLDADDWLYPEALEKMVAEWEAGEACIYSDYVGKAIVDDPAALAKNLKVLHRNGRTGETVIGYQAADYDWERAQGQPEGARPWIWCNITTLVPRRWHEEIGGFDEQMPAWEDVDYWYRMARAGKPFRRIPEPLLVYRFYSGTRRDRGVQMNADLVGYLREKYKGVEPVPCRGCGGSRRAPVAPAGRVTVSRSTPPQLQDEDFVWCIYTAVHRNQQPLIGGVAFDGRFDGLHMIRVSTGGWKIHYGMRQRGDRFLVHRRDVELQPHLFRPVEERQSFERRERPPVPVPILEPEAARPFDPQELPGVTPGIARQMEAAGIESKDQIRALGADGLKRFDGVGDVKARLILEAVG